MWSPICSTISLEALDAKYTPDDLYWVVVKSGSGAYNDDVIYGVATKSGRHIGTCEDEDDAMKIVAEHNSAILKWLKGN